jgi:hypothetical protein
MLLRLKKQAELDQALRSYLLEHGEVMLATQKEQEDHDNERKADKVKIDTNVDKPASERNSLTPVSYPARKRIFKCYAVCI